MDAKKIALLVGALLIAGITAFVAKNMFAGASAPEAVAAAVPLAQAPQGPEILVATRAMPVGTIIGPDSFKYQPWPKELVENAYYLKGEADPASLAGTVVRTAVTAGQPLTQGALVKPGDRGFLAAALGPGMRAVTVSVTEISGVGGFVFPGDRVDMMLTQTVSGEGNPLRATETIVRNLRVLATDRRTSMTTNEQGQAVPSGFTTVTLESTPRIAEKLIVAQGLGTLSLSLRSIADNQSELEQAIAAGDVKLGNGDAAAETRMMAAAAAHPTDRGSTLSTGGDVSRFQRRSMPRQSGSATITQPAPKAPEPPTVRVSRGSAVETVTLGGK